jgi:hypothetical protein
MRSISPRNVAHAAAKHLIVPQRRVAGFFSGSISIRGKKAWL